MSAYKTAQKSSQQTVQLEQFLVYVATLKRAVGYVSKSDASKTGDESTASLAWQWATGNAPLITRNFNISLEDRAQAKQTMRWMESLVTSKSAQTNEYLGTLAGIFQSGVVSERMSGYAASAIASYEKDAQEKLLPTGNFLGEIGKKIIVTGTWKGSNGFDSKFGYCYAHRFQDEKGNVVTWITGKKPEDLGLEQGHNYIVQGTVKKHDSFRGTKQTEITRASVGRAS